MPMFTIHAQHKVATTYKVEAATLDAAIVRVKAEGIEPHTFDEVDDSFEVNLQWTEEAN